VGSHLFEFVYGSLFSFHWMSCCLTDGGIVRSCSFLGGVAFDVRRSCFYCWLFVYVGFLLLFHHLMYIQYVSGGTCFFIIGSCLGGVVTASSLCLVSSCCGFACCGANHLSRLFLSWREFLYRSGGKQLLQGLPILQS